MVARVVNKQLAGLEDLLLGSGTEEQERYSGTREITKINMLHFVASIDAVRLVDYTQFLHVQVESNTTANQYYFDPDATAADDGLEVLTPVTAPATGRWIRQAFNASGSYTRTSTESQIAIAGQTTFTLLTIQYVKDLGSIQVHINGVYQNPDTYTEFSDGVTITFSSALEDGDVVDFTVGEVLGSAPTADFISYTPAGTGAVATNVQDKLQQNISVLDFIPTGLHNGIRAGTNTTDLKAYIQAGIDYVESLIISPQGTPELTFPGGKYLIGSTGDSTGLDLKKANLVGSGAFGCTLVWGGDVDGTLIRYQPVFHKKISGFRLSSSNHPTNRPLHWVDCTWNPDSLPITTMDWGDSFWDLFFDDCSGTSGSAHLNLPDFTNLYMRDIRFQYAKHLVKVDVPTGASANRVMSIEDWTVDLHNSAFSHSDQPESLFQFDMTGAANISLVLRNARIEMTSLDMTGVKAIVEILDSKGPNAIPASGIGLVMENIGLQFSTATGVSLLYQNTTQTTVTSDIMLKNVFLLGVAQIHGGNWSTFFTTPEPEDFSGRIKFWATGRVNRFGQIQLGDIVTVGKEIKFGSGDTQIVLVSGNPEGAITANRGSIAIRDNGSGGGFGFYVKTTDGVNTGWENASVYVGGGAGGTGSAGAGNQYVELNINGTTYKLLHDGTV